MKKAPLLFCIVLICTLFLFVFSGCDKEYESGDFKYIKFGKDSKAYVEITGLTQQAEDKRVVIVPEKIDDAPVTAIWKRSFMNWGEFLVWDTENLEKLYLPYNMSISIDLVSKNDNVSVFIINMNKELYSDGIGASSGFPVSSLHNATLFIDKVYAAKHADDAFAYKYNVANVTYFYNFERADNDGVFWIDNVEEGNLIIDIPPTEPTRERWTFGGWYTEPECVNEWHFDSDKVPADGVDLYAKWL